MDYKNKKIIIFGLGNYKNGSGISAALFFARQGAKILITDLKTGKDLALQLNRLKKFKNIKYHLGGHRENDFSGADFVFKNPGAAKNSPYLEIARRNNIPVINDWTIFFEERPDAVVVGVTGTKGKTVTASQIHHILKTAGKDVVLCGNTGVSPLVFLNKIKKNTIVVAELSSWLLQEFASFKKSPHIAIITNLMPDHLDKYGSLKDYYADKKNIFKFQKKDDFLLFNKNDLNLENFVKSAKSEIMRFSPPELPAAVCAAKIFGIDEKEARKALKSFKGVEGRMEFVVEKNGILYYNDTAATMPEAVIYGLDLLKKYKGRLILIAGGVDKNLDYRVFCRYAVDFVKLLVLFEGTASEKILKCLKNKNGAKKAFETKSGIRNMTEAVAVACSAAKKGDVVLLSPGAASFNLFKNEIDRGKQFVKEVGKIYFNV